MGTPVHLDWIFRESDFLYLYDILNRHHLNIDFTRLNPDDPAYQSIVEFHRLLGRFMDAATLIREAQEIPVRVTLEVTNNKTICEWI